MPALPLVSAGKLAHWPEALLLYEFGDSAADDPFDHIEIAGGISRQAVRAVELAGMDHILRQVRPTLYLHNFLV